MYHSLPGSDPGGCTASLPMGRRGLKSQALQTPKDCLLERRGVIPAVVDIAVVDILANWLKLFLGYGQKFLEFVS